MLGYCDYLGFVVVFIAWCILLGGAVSADTALLPTSACGFMINGFPFLPFSLPSPLIPLSPLRCPCCFPFGYPSRLFSDAVGMDFAVDDAVSRVQTRQQCS